jgi:hypothetical protein
MKCIVISSFLTIGMLPSTGYCQDFHGYACTQDCSGHEAGYEWAERHDVTDPDDCGGTSRSFIEGCRAYAVEHEDDRINDDCEDEDSEDCN